jgi:hypothetical protein
VFVLLSKGQGASRGKRGFISSVAANKYLCARSKKQAPYIAIIVIISQTSEAPPSCAAPAQPVSHMIVRGQHAACRLASSLLGRALTTLEPAAAASVGALPQSSLPWPSSAAQACSHPVAGEKTCACNASCSTHHAAASVASPLQQFAHHCVLSMQASHGQQPVQHSSSSFSSSRCA